MTNPSMHEPAKKPDELERRIDEVLRTQPPMQAPSTLAARVFATLEARHAQPWWRTDFARWPALPRIVFLLLSVALVVAVFMLSTWIFTQGSAQVDAKLAPQARALQGTFGAFVALAQVVSLLLRSISPLWLYGVPTLILAAYCFFFGIGAVAYRSLSSAR